MERVGALGSLALVLRAPGQSILDPDPLDDQHLVLDLDVTFSGCFETSV